MFVITQPVAVTVKYIHAVKESQHI